MHTTYPCCVHGLSWKFFHYNIILAGQNCAGMLGMFSFRNPEYIYIYISLLCVIYSYFRQIILGCIANAFMHLFVCVGGGGRGVAHWEARDSSADRAAQPLPHQIP